MLIFRAICCTRKSWLLGRANELIKKHITMNTHSHTNPYQWISKVLIQCPLFSLPMQCVYILVSLILPFTAEQWHFSNFTLVYFFGALSIFSYVTHRLSPKREYRNDSHAPKWFKLYMQKSLAQPEIDSTLFGIIIFLYLMCSLSGNIILWCISGVVNILAIILLKWYMFKN